MLIQIQTAPAKSLAEVWQAKLNGERPIGPLDFSNGL